MRTNLSNATPEQARERLAELNRQQKCPACGAARGRIEFMRRTEESLSRFLLEQNADALNADSCILCVEKHIGDAVTLTKELLAAAGSGKTVEPGKVTASVNVYRNHLEIIGNLCEAYKESRAWPELHELLKQSERAYRYEGLIPDWNNILALMIEAKRAPRARSAR